MALYLVRHAAADDRLAWSGSDLERPLTGQGRAQAEALARRFARWPVARVLSSPSLRCVQTVAPLAAGAGCPVEPVDALSEGRPARPVLDLLDGLPDGSVLCSHGDVIPELVELLGSVGVPADGRTDWRNASTWVLDRVDGAVVRMQVLAPPVVRAQR